MGVFGGNDIGNDLTIGHGIVTERRLKAPATESRTGTGKSAASAAHRNRAATWRLEPDTGSSTATTHRGSTATHRGSTATHRSPAGPTREAATSTTHRSPAGPTGEAATGTTHRGPAGPAGPAGEAATATTHRSSATTHRSSATTHRSSTTTHRTDSTTFRTSLSRTFRRTVESRGSRPLVDMDDLDRPR